MAKSVANYVEEIKQEKQPQLRHPPKITHPWFPPRQDWYKINTYGAVFREIGSCRSGAVMRNEKGLVMGAMSKRWDLPLRALEIEAKAVEDGVQLAWDLDLNQIIIESDSQTMVNSIHDHNLALSSIQKVIEGIKVEF